MEYAVIALLETCERWMWLQLTSHSVPLEKYSGIDHKTCCSNLQRDQWIALAFVNAIIHSLILIIFPFTPNDRSCPGDVCQAEMTAAFKQANTDACANLTFEQTRTTFLLKGVILNFFQIYVYNTRHKCFLLYQNFKSTDLFCLSVVNSCTALCLMNLFVTGRPNLLNCFL